LISSMGSWPSARSSCGRSTAISSWCRSLQRNGRTSREEVTSLTVQQVGYATLGISTRFGTRVSLKGYRSLQSALADRVTSPTVSPTTFRACS
jgi:hypothetical protein